jgi:hypothetical protein
MGKTFLIIGIILLILLSLAVIAGIFLNKKKKSIKSTILNTECINHKEFEKNWSGGSGRKGFNTGYRFLSCCGCYIITVFSKRVEDGDYTKYDRVYVGSSNNVFLKIHNHFTGRGNPEIANACKKGKYVYVSIVPCEKEKLEKTEKQLTAIFSETKLKNPFKK